MKSNCSVRHIENLHILSTDTPSVRNLKLLTAIGYDSFELIVRNENNEYFTIKSVESCERELMQAEEMIRKFFENSGNSKKLTEEFCIKKVYWAKQRHILNTNTIRSFEDLTNDIKNEVLVNIEMD